MSLHAGQIYLLRAYFPTDTQIYIFAPNFEQNSTKIKNKI